MKVKYIAKTHVCLSVLMANGSTKHVSFNPITGGKSVFYTEDEALQSALENHYKYGKLFKREEEVKKVASKATAKKAKTTEAKSATTIREVQVSDLGLAKEYLVTHYGVSRTKIKTAKQIEDFAAKQGIKFVGI